jgi:hypothetical protein
VKDLKPF